MNAAKFALLITLGMALYGCATPRYQTFYSYQPPTDSAGLNCLKPCAKTQEICLDQCSDSYAACVHALEPEVQARYRDALLRYAGELKQYHRDLNHYYLSLSLGWSRRSAWYGIGHYDPWWPYAGYRPYDDPPEPPPAPNYADELNRLSAERCDRDCGCQTNYDACFLGCGGIKTPQQRCIANCPKQP